MRRRLVSILLAIALLLSVRPAFSGLGAAGEEDVTVSPKNGLPLVLVWRDGHGLFPYDRGPIAREIESIFASIGVRVGWKWDDEPQSPGRPELNVVLMPSDPSGPGWKSDEHAMGLFIGADGKGRSVYIFLPNVMRTVAMNPKDMSILTPPEIRDLARALARVIAHEVVHAVAPSLPHSAEGLMAGNLNASVLTKKTITLDLHSARGFIYGLGEMKPPRFIPIGVAPKIAQK